MSAEIVMIGGGGHARVLVDALRAGGDLRSIAALDNDPARAGAHVLDAPIVGGDDALPELITRGAHLFAIGIGSPVSGTMRPRRLLYERLLGTGLVPLTIIHPRSIVSKAATIGPGAQILAGAIVNAGAQIGVNTIVNSGAIVEHDCEIGDHVHVATGARLASSVNVGIGAHIGAGATIRQLVTIGADAVIGAGAVVVRDVAAGSIVAGVPARPLTPRA